MENELEIQYVIFRCGNSSVVDCKAKESEKIMRDICEGKQSCIVNPDNSVFGNPCPGTEKYVHVDYSCMKRK